VTDTAFDFRRSRLTDEEIDMLFMAMAEKQKPYGEVIETLIARLPESKHDKVAEAWEKTREYLYRQGELAGIKAERAARHVEFLIEREKKRLDRREG
jgi:gentisate 1,2-dioxygenase